MSPAQAQARLRKLYGKRAYWRVDDRAPKAPERAAAAASIPTLRTDLDVVKEAMDAKRRELLSDPTYKRMCAEYDAAHKAFEHACYCACWYRVSVGSTNGIGFHVEGQGDVWADAIADLERKRGTP